MKFISSLLIIITVFLLITACNEDGSNALQDTHPPLGPEETETTDEGYTQINQPGQVTFDESGDNWDAEEDKKTIKAAAERMPHVTVDSVTVENKKATVFVTVDQAIDANERSDWQENIESAIQAVIPRYETEVIVAMPK